MCSSATAAGVIRVKLTCSVEKPAQMAVENGEARDFQGEQTPAVCALTSDGRWLTWHIPASAPVILNNDVYLRNSEYTLWMAGIHLAAPPDRKQEAPPG